MPQNDGPFRDGLQKFTLLQWGVFCIFGGGVGGMLVTSMPANNQAELIGRGAGALLFSVVGVVLVILHFVRRDRSKKTDNTKRKAN